MAIDTVPPLIGTQLNYLLTHCPFSVKVEQMWSGCKNPNLRDRFTLVIPYCLDYIKWDVIYNATYPLAAPDIIFGPEDESFQPYSGKSSKNGLANWNSRDPTRLLSLIIELRDAYVAYQRRRIEEVDDDRLKFEISTMVSREGIEMYMSSGTDKPEEVKFAVPLLDMDLNRLVVGSTWRHPQKIYLQLKALFSVEDFKLPTWLDGMCTAEYLPTLEEMLNSQIKDAVSSIEARRKFIQSLAPHFGRPIEADPGLLQEGNIPGFFWSVLFSGLFLSLSLQFPKQKPTIILQSSQHFNSHGVPVKSPTITEYPWSPRWEPSEMAERFFDFLADESLSFKKYCNQLNQQ